MAKNYYLRFTMRNNTEDVVFEVREDDSDRLRSSLDNNALSVSFFWFDSVDGRSVVINLSELQTVRYLWEPAAAPSDHIRNEGLINVFLKGKDLPIEFSTENLDQLYDFFTNLEHGPDVEPFPSLLDEDGELIQFNSTEIVMVTAPTHMIDEGKLKIIEEENLKN